MSKLLIENGHLIDPGGKENTGMDVVIEDGIVVDWLKDSSDVGDDFERFDATGLIVAPGFIDLHVHLREPGQEHKETIETGCRAAVAGQLRQRDDPSQCCSQSTAAADQAVSSPRPVRSTGQRLSAAHGRAGGRSVRDPLDARR